jgi:hypothetical protein
VRARDRDRVIYTVPDACVHRLSPTPLLAVGRDPASGDLVLRFVEGLPRGVKQRLEALAMRAATIEVIRCALRFSSAVVWPRGSICLLSMLTGKIPPEDVLLARRHTVCA